jgi:hypothetical protein
LIQGIRGKAEAMLERAAVAKRRDFIFEAGRLEHCVVE